MCLSLQVAVVGSVEMPKADLWVIFAVLSTVIGYCAKTYFTLSNLFCFLLYGMNPYAMHVTHICGFEFIMEIGDPGEVFL